MAFRHGFILILITFLLLGCERRCENGDFDLKLVFHDETGAVFNPVFDRVFSNMAEGDYLVNSTIESMPINLSSDSTIMVFVFQGQFDTLAFKYTRDLNVGNYGQGYCMVLQDPLLLETNSFSNTSITFNVTGFNSSSDDEFKAHIYF